MLQISRIRINNVRCFKSLDVRIPRSTDGGWTVFVGDNATGKSALLRSIAIGLCDEAGAAGLLKESDEGYIRRKCDQASITIDLYKQGQEANSQGQKANTYQIRTIITRKHLKRRIFRDIVRQRTKPAQFPWDELFVSAYGAGRSVAGTGDIAGYSVIDAVYNLFNYSEGLQNPELTIRRLQERRLGREIDQQEILKAIQRFCDVGSIRLTSHGIVVDGSWGEAMPLRDLADGYRSAFTWIADLIGWSLAFRPRVKSSLGVRGVVLIDEIEQHLHARWQRAAVSDLRELFPNVQFLCTTHSPLIAASVGSPLRKQETDSLFVLEEYESEGVTASTHEFMLGWTMDQVLASRAFKYQMPTTSAYDSAMRDASKLLGAKSRTKEEDDFLRHITKILSESRLIGLSPLERKAEQLQEAEILNEIKRLKSKLFPGN